MQRWPENRAATKGEQSCRSDNLNRTAKPKGKDKEKANYKPKENIWGGEKKKSQTSCSHILLSALKKKEKCCHSLSNSMPSASRPLIGDKQILKSVLFPPHHFSLPALLAECQLLCGMRSSFVWMDLSNLISSDKSEHLCRSGARRNALFTAQQANSLPAGALGP